jgi:hypothetical protein
VQHKTAVPVNHLISLTLMISARKWPQEIKKKKKKKKLNWWQFGSAGPMKYLARSRLKKMLQYFLGASGLGFFFEKHFSDSQLLGTLYLGSLPIGRKKGGKKRKRVFVNPCKP